MLIDRVRELVGNYEDKEANVGWPRHEEFNYKMAQALIAMDEVLNNPNPYIVSGPHLDQRSFDNGYKAAFNRIRKVMESTEQE